MVIQPDTDVDQTLLAFREVQQALAEPCFNDGKPLGALALQRLMYHTVKGSLSAQMTISALRTVCAAYQRAKSHKKPAQHPFLFKKARALFLLGKRGRDADFREDGTLSIWTVGGRTHLHSAVPEDLQATLSQAKELASLHVIKRDGKLIGRVTLTLQAPDPQGLLPVGIDLNETNALGAVDPDGRELFMSGKATRVKNCRTARTRARLQRKQAARKAEHKETGRVRRVFKRLGRKQRNRTRTFAQQTAKQLVTWAPENAVLGSSTCRSPNHKRARSEEGRFGAAWDSGNVRLSVPASRTKHRKAG